MTRVRILYVDDEPDIREIAALALQLDPDFEVRTESAGPSALALLKAGGWRPDVILLDLMMPGMDGLALMGEIRRIADYLTTAVVFVTAKAAPADAERLMAQGARGVIVKPFDPMTLARDLRRIITG